MFIYKTPSFYSDIVVGNAQISSNLRFFHELCMRFPENFSGNFHSFKIQKYLFFNKAKSYMK